jgi:hypothetical protein
MGTEFEELIDLIDCGILENINSAYMQAYGKFIAAYSSGGNGSRQHIEILTYVVLNHGVFITTGDECEEVAAMENDLTKKLEILALGLYSDPRFYMLMAAADEENAAEYYYLFIIKKWANYPGWSSVVELQYIRTIIESGAIDITYAYWGHIINQCNWSYYSVCATEKLEEECEAYRALSALIKFA